jgi:signal transduction histidine kinase
MISESVVHEFPPGPAGLAFQEEARMFENAKAKVGSRRRRRHRARHDRWDAALDDEGDTSAERLAEIDPSLLSEEERAYQSAQRRADRKIALARRGVKAALITVPLLVFLPFAGFCALIYFGVDLGRKAFRLFYEPQLRERFLQEEVQQRVHNRVRSESRHLEGEHQRSLEELSASIAHEIRNPITAAKSLVQQMNEEPNGEDQAEYARVALAELERVERSISHLLRFAREEEIRLEAIDVEDVIESAVETFRERCGRSGVEILRDCDVRGQIEGDPEQLRRVLINLIGNAMDSLEEAHVSAPRIRIGLGENLAGSEVWIRVGDNGLGIDEQTQRRIFDPFFTSREAGTGLGLALCRKVIDDHGGTIEVDSTPGEGTEFVLTIPKVRAR